MSNTIPPSSADTSGPGGPRIPGQLHDQPGSGERYAPRRQMSRGRKIGLGIVGLAILGGVVGYIGWEQANPAIQATVVSFIPSVDSVQVVFEVDKAAGKSADCTLEAQDVHGNVIGTATVQIPAGRAKNDVSYDLSTTQTANTVVVGSCQVT